MNNISLCETDIAMMIDWLAVDFRCLSIANHILEIVRESDVYLFIWAGSRQCKHFVAEQGGSKVEYPAG
jgi:hypothetical protein